MLMTPFAHDPFASRSAFRFFLDLITSSSDFATAFSVVFTPLGNESTYEIQKRYPAASETMQHIGEYQTAMAELRDAVQPELDLIDSRILAPAKEYQELVKKVRKAIVKRDHKVGWDGLLGGKGTQADSTTGSARRL
jgi:hypothetical protein